MLLPPGMCDGGNLTISELYGLCLDAELVALSACETGIGSVTVGDDVIGVTRGFLCAVAQTLLASLWPVSDAGTAYRADQFCGALYEQSRAEALRQLVFATHERHPYPAYWSALNLIGARVARRQSLV